MTFYDFPIVLSHLADIAVQLALVFRVGVGNGAAVFERLAQS